jgi:hypothetical protein
MCKPADFFEKLSVREGPRGLCGFVGFPNDGRSLPKGVEVFFKNIFGEVEFAIQKPAYVWLLKIPLQNFVPSFSPIKRVRDACPKLFGLGDAILVFV